MSPSPEVPEIRTIQFVPIRQLLLDPENPRIVDDLEYPTQDNLAVYLALAENAVEVAASIARNGFFPSEPLIVMPAPDDNNAGEQAWIVLEGNRRLTALRGLVYEATRSQFENAARWDPLSSAAKSWGLSPDYSIPVVPVADRSEALAVIGNKHIVGIVKWEPLAKARFISRLIDDRKMSFAEVAAELTTSITEIQTMYRDHAMARQARDLGIDTGSLESAFSVLRVAMGKETLRNHAGAPLAKDVVAAVDPIAEDRVDGMREVFGWVFGTAEIEPVITDSRQLTTLARVVASQVGLGALRDGETLEQAEQKVKGQALDPRAGLANGLRTAKNALSAAGNYADAVVTDEEIDGLLSDVEEALSSVVSSVRGINGAID